MTIGPRLPRGVAFFDAEDFDLDKSTLENGNWFKLLEREEISIDTICLRSDGDIPNDEEYANYKKTFEAR